MDNNTIEKEIGKTTVSTDVLHKIAYLTTMSVEGVSRMTNTRGNFEQLLSNEDYKGAKVQIRDDQVFVEIYVVLTSGMNVRDISREIQSRVSRTISEMIGMEVGGVNIHITDIDFSA